MGRAADDRARHPEKVRELIDLWFAEAEKYEVLPLADLERQLAAAPARD